MSNPILPVPPTGEGRDDVTCEHGTAMDVHCCNCHSGFIFDASHECPYPFEGHSGGPWKWLNYPDGRKLLSNAKHAVIHCPDSAMGIDEADQRLIAAAPDLLRELSILRASYEALQAENERLKAAALKAVDDEEELDGPMPEQMRGVFMADPETTMRSLVRTTKRCIRERMARVFTDGAL